MKFYKLVSCFVMSLVLLGMTSSIVVLQAEEGEDHGHASEHDHGHEHDAKPEKRSKLEQFKKKVVRLPSFGRFAPDLRQLCGALEKDGRKEFFYQVATTHSVKNPVCPQCKDFFKTVAKACVVKTKTKVAPKKTKKGKAKAERAEDTENTEEESETSPSPSASPRAFKQRYPNVDVLQIASRLGQALAEKQELIEGYYQVAKIFEEKLIQDTNVTPALKDYLDSFMDAMLLPFESYEKHLKFMAEKAKNESKAENKEIVDPHEGVDLLFEE